MTGYYRKKFRNDISPAEVDSRKCWVSKDQKFHAKNEFGTLSEENYGFTKKSYSSNRIRNSARSSLQIFRRQAQKMLQKSGATISAIFYVTLVNLF